MWWYKLTSYSGPKVRKVRSTKSVADGAAFIAESLSFLARSVRVDNYSGRWCRVEPDRRYIPPFTVGVIVNLFVETQTVSVVLGSPTAVVIPGTAIQGEIAVEIYAEDLPVSGGEMINPPWVQTRDTTTSLRSPFDDDIPAAYEQYELGAFGPLNFARGLSNEGFEQIQQRQLTTLGAFYLDILVANVLTNLATFPTTEQRLLYLSCGVDRTCELQIEYSVWGNLYNGIAMPGIPVVIPLPNNGFNLNGGALSHLRAQVDVVPTRVYYGYGVGPE